MFLLAITPDYFLNVTLAFLDLAFLAAFVICFPTEVFFVVPFTTTLVSFFALANAFLLTVLMLLALIVTLVALSPSALALISVTVKVSPAIVTVVGIVTDLPFLVDPV